MTRSELEYRGSIERHPCPEKVNENEYFWYIEIEPLSEKLSTTD
jgi:hypothetical protein